MKEWIRFVFWVLTIGWVARGVKPGPQHLSDKDRLKWVKGVLRPGPIKCGNCGFMVGEEDYMKKSFTCCGKCSSPLFQFKKLTG